MQLIKIKLSGFKSFVEKTEIIFSEKRTGIVGPNGCGKSNIIDAVRWVLGESRVTELRGESLQDVIFSGSSTRHKAGRASVELFFDNPDGKVSGPWGEFPEISVKRTVTSDGQSNSFINDRNVRRKDILDLFLGTGLGPKSYAIIGQGMIGKIVDAKPDELRVFLEEASGVSKYRQRRKETESRLSDGRESMSRVSDLINELDRRTKNLESQAETAEVYREKNESKKNLQLFLLWKKKIALTNSIEISEKELLQEKLECEKIVANIRTVELEIASNRDKADVLQKNLDKDNQSYFEINNEISKQENHNRLIKEKILHSQEILNSASLMINNVESSIGLEKQSLLQHDVKLRESEELISKKSTHLSDFKTKISPTENSLNEIQIKYTEVRAEFAVLESEKLNYKNQTKALLETREKQVSRIDELNSELNSIESVSLSQINDLEESSNIKNIEAQKAKDNVLIVQEKQENAQLEFQQANLEYTKIDKDLHALSAEFSGLTSTQKKLLDLDTLDNWLKKNNLPLLPSLVSLLKVNPDWETAVESVLKNKLGSLQIDSLDKLINLTNEKPPVSISFFSTDTHENVNKQVIDVGGYKNLSFAIESENEASRIISELLKDYFCITDIKEAIRNQHKLNFHSKFITPEGNILGKIDLFFQGESSSSSLLSREEKIDSLKKELKNHEIRKKEFFSSLNVTKANLEVATKELEKSRENLTVCVQEAHEAELKLVVLREKSDSISQQKHSITKDLDSVSSDLEITKSELLSVERKMSQNKEDIDLSQNRLDELDQKLSVTMSELAGLNEELKKLEDELQFLKLDQRSIIESRGAIEKRIEDFDFAKKKSITNKDNASQEIIDLEKTIQENTIDRLLDSQRSIEEKLKESRNLLESKNSETRNLEEKRLRLEREIAPLREKISSFEMEKSRLHGVLQELNEQFLASGLDKSDVQTKIIEKSRNFEKLSTENIEKQINKLSQEISNLGMVNLAAINELNEVVERHDNFVSQLKDLEEAESELTQAIKRMDVETKDQLQKTFQLVNENLKLFFTSLFGGGYSKLIFLDDDILNSGINLMAQPPGKKITRIQQLSGGEKSLAAIALVFSFFKLNPAPFCILDEADAALDEANTVGLNGLLTDLSDITQFIFITHNKTLMEIAEQLIGITMQELGVSRAVTVDLKSAESLVEEAA